MDSLNYAAHQILFRLMIILSLLCLQYRAENVGSVLFIDSPTHQYIRNQPSDGVSEGHSISVMEVGAAVSVLLGLAPQSTLSAASSAKLNEILIPNPFDRPHHVFVLEVGLAKDSQDIVYPHISMVKSSIKNKLTNGGDKYFIELSDVDKAAYISLDGLHSESYANLTEKETSDFASWLGGSYVANGMASLNGKLMISLPDGTKMTFDLSKKPVKEFIMNLISLTSNIRKAMVMHSISGNNHNAAKLLAGSFHGIQALQKEYGPNGIAEVATELFLTSVSKLIDSLQASYRGELVGVLVFNEAAESEKLLDVISASHPRPYARWLKEAESSSNSTIAAEVILVRRTLAWVTAIVLLISTLIGVCLLKNMSLTRDTLLYSNVKLE